MNTERALLHELIAHPEDDLPRLLLADWWEEYGEAGARARAQLIRLQIERSRGQLSRDRLSHLRTQERELLQIYQGCWLQDLPRLDGVDWSTEFIRGFIETVLVATPQHFVRAAPSLFASAPIRSVGIRSVASRADLETLLTSPWLELVRELDLGHAIRSPEVARALDRFPVLPNLTALLLHDTNLSREGLAALARASGFPALTELYLSGNELLDADVVSLAGCARFPALRLLDLRDNRVGSAGLAVLASSPHFQGLTDLWLVNNHIGGEGVVGLCNSAAGSRMPHLRSLWLNYNPITDTGAIALAGDPARTSLRDLDLRNAEIGDPGGQALADSSFLQDLDLLQGTGNLLSRATVHRLRERFGPRVRV